MVRILKGLIQRKKIIKHKVNMKKSEKLIKKLHSKLKKLSKQKHNKINYLIKK
jgi:hypothetical protein